MTGGQSAQTLVSSRRVRPGSSEPRSFVKLDGAGVQMSEASVPSVPQLVVSLEIVERWREETETEVTRQIKEIDEEEERLNANIAELQRQLKAVAALREEMQVRLAEQAPRRRGARAHSGRGGVRA